MLGQLAGVVFREIQDADFIALPTFLRAPKIQTARMPRQMIIYDDVGRGRMTCGTRLLDFVVIHYKSHSLIVEDADSVEEKARG